MSVMDKNLHDFLGYAKMSKFVSKSPFVSMGAKTVYTNFKQYAFENVDSEVFPARETIAAELGCHVNTLDKYIKELKELGLMNVIRQGVKRPNLYELEEINLELIFNVLKPKLNAKEIDKLNKYIRSKRLHKVYEIKGDSHYIVNHRKGSESHATVSQESHATVSQESHATVNKEEQVEKEQIKKNKKEREEQSSSHSNITSKKDLAEALKKLSRYDKYGRYKLKMQYKELVDFDNKDEFTNSDFVIYYIELIEKVHSLNVLTDALSGAEVSNNAALNVIINKGSITTILNRLPKRSDFFSYIEDCMTKYKNYTLPKSRGGFDKDLEYLTLEKLVSPGQRWIVNKFMGANKTAVIRVTGGEDIEDDF